MCLCMWAEGGWGSPDLERSEIVQGVGGGGWVMQSLAPDHNTISNFRKDNAISIKNVFFATVEIARNFGLIGATLIAGDSTNFRAQNSKKNNFNQKKIQRLIDYIINVVALFNIEKIKRTT